MLLFVVYGLPFSPSSRMGDIPEGHVLLHLILPFLLELLISHSSRALFYIHSSSPHLESSIKIEPYRFGIDFMFFL